MWNRLSKNRFLILVGLTVVIAILVFPFLRGPRNGRPRPGRPSMSARPHLDEADAKRSGNKPTGIVESQTDWAESRADDSKEKESAESTSISQVNSKFSSSSSEVASSWSRFRGPNGTGYSEDKNIPVAWSDSENVRWKVALQGAGASSPVLTDKYVLVTSYSGYGEPGTQQGNLDDLKRYIECFDRKTGKSVWSNSVAATLPEDPYQGKGIPEHGYATNTPVTDGQAVYAFFGKSGVHAFTLDGARLWQKSVGAESSNREWGSAASLILYNNLLIVNASEESQSLYALDTRTGEVVWDAAASTLELTYGTPAIMHVDENRDDLVIAVPGEVWGLNPNNGKLVWYVETSLTDNLSPSIVVDGLHLYVFGGFRSSGSMAIKGGGKGNVTKSHVLWTSRNSSYVATPVLLKEKLFWIDDRGLFYCIDAKSGELINRSRVTGMDRSQRPVYASPVVINEKIYAQTRNSGVFVLAGTSDLKILAQNTFAKDESICNACPAVDNGQLFIRSDKNLYCMEKLSN